MKPRGNARLASVVQLRLIEVIVVTPMFSAPSTSSWKRRCYIWRWDPRRDEPHIDVKWKHDKITK
jgi:hypothetical protein